MKAKPAPSNVWFAYSLEEYIVTMITMNNIYSAISRTRITKYLFSPFRNGVSERENTQVNVPIPQRNVA